jgi:hypothetical protein
MRAVLVTVLLVSFASMLLTVTIAAQEDAEAFHQEQIDHYLNGLHNEAAANARVRGIWGELAMYSHRMFSVLPAQQFNAGQALPSGIILLDLSIAADPNEEVTRFFLAHEWGHMMHGDPLKSLTPLGRYLMATGGTQIEDKADDYAATFMSRQNHDIEPVIDFFCQLPDSGPNDSHSSGPVRARRIAGVFGLHEDNPCANAERNPHGESTVASDPDLDAGIKKMAIAARNNFTQVHGRAYGDDSFYSSVKLTTNGKANECEMSIGDCSYILNKSVSQSGSESAFLDMVQRVQSAVPDWKKTEYRCSDPNALKHVEWKSSDAQPAYIALDLSTTPKTNESEFVTLDFVPPDYNLTPDRDGKLCDPVVAPTKNDALAISVGQYLKQAIGALDTNFTSIKGDVIEDNEYRSKLLLSYGSEVLDARIYTDTVIMSTVIGRSFAGDEITGKYDAFEADLESALVGWDSPKKAVADGFPQVNICKTTAGPCVALRISTDDRGPADNRPYLLKLFIAKQF